MNPFLGFIIQRGSRATRKIMNHESDSQESLLWASFGKDWGGAPRVVSSTTFASQRARMMSRRRHRDDQELSDEPREVHMNSHVLSL